MKEVLEKNIKNLKEWLSESPNDEDYKRLLEEFKKELEKMN